MFRLYRRERHARVIHPKAQVPVDMEQVRELTRALESSPDSTRYKVALLEAETFGFLIDESLALVDDGLRLHKVLFERAHSEPALAELVSKDINGAPMNRLLRAHILHAYAGGASRVLLEKKSDIEVTTYASDGGMRHSEGIPETIPENLWTPIKGWAVRTKEIGWREMLFWYEGKDGLPVDLEVEVSDSSIVFSW
jgi:hypothetical protein